MIESNILALIASEKHFTKKGLAEHIGIVRSTLDFYLSGKWPIPSDKIPAIAEYFGVSVSVLFGEKQSRRAPTSSIMQVLNQQQQQLKKLNETLETIAKLLQEKK